MTDIQSIRERHEKCAFTVTKTEWTEREAFNAHTDRATLLSALTASEARAEAAEVALKKVRDLLEMAESDDHNGYISIADNRRKDALKVVYGAMKGTPDGR